MKFYIMTVSLFIAALSSCSKENIEDGRNCSELFISGYNNVIFETEFAISILSSSFLTSAEKIDQLKNAAITCENFYNIHLSKSCRSTVDKEKWLSYADLKNGCEEVKLLMLSLEKNKNF